MLTCFVDKAQSSIPITVVFTHAYPQWLTEQDAMTQSWLNHQDVQGENNNLTLLRDAHGQLTGVVFCLTDIKHFLLAGQLPISLPKGCYHFAGADHDVEQLAIAWGMGAYQFTRYKKSAKSMAQLLIDNSDTKKRVENIVSAIYLVRDLINTPTDDMGPTELSQAVQTLAQEFDARFQEIVGEDLLTENYPSIHTVGRASDDAPRLLDLRWGAATHPKITLVGKGVCFDTGGLDLKSSGAMLLMKKDMGGAANALGLARMIMAANLPVCLRVLIPAVENSVSGNAYRPGDVITSRKGITIEVGNTDAEGRVVMADALAEAVTESPDLLIDLSTLTGAARIALGTDIAVMFSNDDKLAAELFQYANDTVDPIWQLPLYAGYREAINGSIADLNNSASDSYGGAITAALFLQEFVPPQIPWVHFDMMAWNLRSKPGKPTGGEAMAIRALFGYICTKFAE